MTTPTQKTLVLYTFPPVPKAYTVCPFALKAESFLRVNKVPYEKCYTSAFGKNRTIPYLRIFQGDRHADPDDFQEISDSNEIIAHVLKDPEIDTTSCEENLSKEQKAIAHSCIRMIEEHTAQTGFYFRYRLNVAKFFEATGFRERVFNGDESTLGSMVFGLFKRIIPKQWGRKAAARGFTRYSSPDVVWAMSCEDLQALEDLIAWNPDEHYFFGRSNPGVLDCAVFGHLSQFLYIDADFPQHAYLKESCPCLLRFMDHFKQAYYPDWETLCERKANEKMSGGSPRARASKKGSAAMASCIATVAIAAGAMVCKKLQKSAK